jgi:quinoprotein dehydrogenase-associated probable ABC transporter substrate-binding protein
MVPNAFAGRPALLAILLLGLPGLAAAQRPGPMEAGVLRVCADPDNLPVSDSTKRGFENKLAQLIADTWHADLRYVWWPARFGYFNRGLNGLYCDVEISAPAGLDVVATTRPYYRSAYVIVYRKDSGLNITSLSDTTLKHLKIGVNMVGSDGDAGPPAAALKSHGVVGLVGFPTFFSEINRPEDVVNAVTEKKVDVAIVWGPVAGYFAAKSSAPLVLNPILADSATGIPFSFPIAMAVARRNKVLRDSLQTFLDQNRGKVEGILRSYGVPLFPLADSTRSAASPPKDSSAGGTRSTPKGR